MTEQEESVTDYGPKASMDVQSLNNLVVSMRNLMKKVKLYTIHKLVKNSKELRAKKCTEEKKKQLVQKAERLILDVGAIKQLNIDRTIKFALGNTLNFSALAGSPDLAIRAKGRLATHPLIVSRIEQWRSEHDDWKSLAAFINSKNTGRRMKKNNQKDQQEKKDKSSNSKQKSPKDNQIDDEDSDHITYKKVKVAKVGEGKSAKEMALLARKNSKKLKLLKARANPSDSHEKSLDVVPEGESDQVESTVRSATGDKRKDSLAEKEMDTGDQEELTRETKEDEVSASEEEENTGEGDSDSGEGDSDSGEGDSNSGEGDSDSEESDNTPDKDDHEPIPASQEEPPRVSPKKKKVEVKPFVKRSGDMVISKFDMGALSSEASIPLASTEENTSLISDEHEDKAETKTKSKKKVDNFFLTGDSDDEEEQDEEEIKNKEKSVKRRVDYEPTRTISKRKMESTFVTNLGEKNSRLWFTDFHDDPEDERQNKYRKANDPREKKRPAGSWSQQADNSRPNQRGGRSNESTAVSKEDTDAGPLHPSWEARKKKKEQEKDIFSFAGKRTTFDD